jgi:hypothetical protein
MARLAIDIDRQRVAEFCARHHIRRLALFGSVLRREGWLVWHHGLAAAMVTHATVQIAWSLLERGGATGS